MIQEIKNKYHRELAGLYPKSEIDSFLSILFKHIINKSRLELALRPDIELSVAQQNEFAYALNRLKKEEPIQYIIGETEFYGLKFLVNKSVLIPRPETEELVDWMLKDAASAPPQKILDMGTGSGCIAITLAKHLPNVQVSAWDVSDQALGVAAKNAEDNKVAIDFEEEDILKYTNPQSLGLDWIVSNPPYVRNVERTEMKANVLEYEPHLALFVEDEDPLLFYRKIIDFALVHLMPKGRIYFEINEFLKEDLIDLMHQKQIENYEFRKDFLGKYRMLRIEL